MAGDNGVLPLGVAILKPGRRCPGVSAPQRESRTSRRVRGNMDLSVHPFARAEEAVAAQKTAGRGQNSRRAAGGAAGSPGAGGVLEEKRAGGLRRLLTEHRTGGARRRGGADKPGADRYTARPGRRASGRARAGRSHDHFSW